MEQSLQWTLFFCVVGILWLIFTPFAVYCIVRFSLYRNDIIIHKRYPTLTLVFGVITVFAIILLRPLYIFMYTLCDDPQHDSLDCPLIEERMFNVMYYVYMVMV